MTIATKVSTVKNAKLATQSIKAGMQKSYYLIHPLLITARPISCSKEHTQKQPATHATNQKKNIPNRRLTVIAVIKKQTYTRGNRVKNAKAAINQPIGKTHVLITIKQISH